MGEDYWELELVPEKDGHRRAYVDDINYERWICTAREESELHQADSFMKEEVPLGHYDIFEDDIKFEFSSEFLTFRDDWEEWGWNFNAEIHPTSNPFFRRAFVFATDRTGFERDPRREIIDLNGHPFLDDERLSMWVSDEMIEQLTDYGVESEWDAAEEELKTGGFERNADGEWLFQEDTDMGDAGAPIHLDISALPWMGYVADKGSDFFADISDFGISVEAHTAFQDPWTIQAGYMGGMTPEFVFETVFGEEPYAFTMNNGFGESVMAPPVGEPSVDQDEWEEYDTRATTDRLGVTVDPAVHQEMVDDLTWVSNQIMPRAGVVATTQVFHTNANRWSVTPPVDAPDQWTRRPEHILYTTGLLQYVPQ